MVDNKGLLQVGMCAGTFVVGDLREIGKCCWMLCRIVGARERLDEFWRVDLEEKVALLLGKGVEGICNRVMEEMGECVLYWLGRWWQRRK